jgi:Flp pilus assembly pilin Flp
MNYPLKAARKDEKGVTTMEYAIMLALIALAVAGALPDVRDAVVGIFQQAATILNGV